MVAQQPMRFLCAMSIAVVGVGCARSRSTADPDLASYVDTLAAIDSHAHPMAYVAPGAPADSDFDALPLDGIPLFALPLALRPHQPAYHVAQRALYGVSAGDSGSAEAAAFGRARADVIKRQGERFPDWVLGRLHIDVMLANRIAMGSGLQAPRFRWVAFDDALLLPLDTRGEAAHTPDTQALYPLEARLLRRYLADLRLAQVPATLADYERDVVTATLERQRAGGAVAIKFEIAYLRPLDFEPADSAAAATIYARYALAGTPTGDDYRTLENYLMRYTVRESGRLGMAVQIHCTDGFGGYYNAAGAAPHLLESLFDDPSLRGAHFIVVHGGWPLVRETTSLLGKPNVYADISMMDQLADPAALAQALRMWLTVWPEKVMFGTDAFDGGDQQGWEQVAWVAAHNARRGLTTALEAMERDHEITPQRARQLSRMVLHDNAMAAYRFTR